MHRRPTIVCAWADGTPPQVAEVSAWLARELDASIVLTHAFDAMAVQVPRAGRLAMAGITTNELADAERDRARQQLGLAADRISDVEHLTVVVDGRPVPALLQLGDEHHASLMVAGTTRRGTLDRIFAGSVAAELANRARCPVIAVSDGASVAADGPLVLGYDGSDHSVRAARCAAVLAAALRRQLIMVHVAEHETERVGVEASLVQELRGASRDGPSVPTQDLDVSFRVVHGRPAEQLVEFAGEQDAAILITGTRGRGAISSALLGSVSAAVVRAAPAPVMLVGPAVVPAPLGGRSQA
jgi:nucleotide-binding universal stress UspA family protein